MAHIPQRTCSHVTGVDGDGKPLGVEVDLKDLRCPREVVAEVEDQVVVRLSVRLLDHRVRDVEECIPTFLQGDTIVSACILLASNSDKQDERRGSPAPEW